MVATESAETAAQPGRVERKRTRKIRDILLATAEVLNRDGYYAMSLEDVAERTKDGPTETPKAEAPSPTAYRLALSALCLASRALRHAAAEH